MSVREEEKRLTKADWQFKLRESLLEDLICKTCGALPTTESSVWYNCPRNHAICVECQDFRCMCDANVNDVPCKLREKILKIIPINCKNYDSGCEVILKKEEMPRHQENCRYRSVRCVDVSCGKEVVFKDFPEHFRNFHEAKGGETLETDNLSKVKLDSQLNLESLAANESWEPVKIRIGDKTFYEVGCVRNQFMYRWISFPGNHQEVANFKYSAKIRGTNEEELTYKGWVRSIDDDYEDIIHDQTCFVVGVNTAERMMADDGNLKYSVTIDIVPEKELLNEP